MFAAAVAWAGAASASDLPAANNAQAPELTLQQRADYGADGAQLAQARYCGYPHADLGRLAEKLRARARAAAESVQLRFNDEGYREAFRAGVREMDEMLGLVDPASRDRECAHVREEIEPLLK